MKKALKVIIPLLLVIAVGVGAFFFLKNYEPYNLRSIQKDPAAQLMKSLRKTGEALEEGLAFKIPNTIKSAPKTGAISIELLTPEQTKYSNTLYLRDKSFTLTGTISDARETAEYGLWLSEESLVTLLPEQMGGRAYGLYFETIAEDIVGSPLLETLGVAEEDMQQFFNALKQMSPKEEETNNADWKRLLETKRQTEELLKRCAVSVEKYPVTLGYESVEAFCITYTLTPAQLCEALDIWAYWLRSTEAYQLAQEDYTEADEELEAWLEEAKSQITALNATTMLEVFLHPETQVIMLANLHTDWLENKNTGNITATLYLGADPVMSTLYDLTLSMKGTDDTKEQVQIQYQRSHAHNLPNRKLVVTSDDESVVIYDIQINSLTGSFDLELLDRSMKITGKGMSDEAKTTITFTEESIGEVTLVFAAGVEAPEKPHFLNLLTMKQNEVDALLENIQALVPEPAPEEMKTADIFISDSSWNSYFSYISHDYDTLGELLQEEGLAILENGSIAEIICDDDFANKSWEVYIDGVLITGDLYEYELPPKLSIAITEAEPES